MAIIRGEGPQDLGRLANNGANVQDLQSILSKSDMNVGLLPKIVQRIVKEEAWREYVMPGNDDVIYRWNPAEFRRFIEAPRAEGGCQMPIQTLERVLRCSEAWSIFLELTGRRAVDDVKHQAAKLSPQERQELRTYLDKLDASGADAA